MPSDAREAIDRHEEPAAWVREARRYLPPKPEPKRYRDLRWAVVLIAVALAILVQRLTPLAYWLTDEEMFRLQAFAVFPGVIGLGFLTAFLFVRNGNGSE